MSRFFLFAVLVILSACGKKQATEGNAPRAFYFWQTSISAFDWRDSTFQDLKVNKIYYRFFDVDWNAEAKAPVPVSPLDLDNLYGWEAGREVIPVVFITNETFKNLSVEESKALAHPVHHKILARLNRLIDHSVDYDGNGGWWQQDPYQIKSKKFDEQQRYDSMYRMQAGRIREIQFDCDWTASTKDKYFAFLEESTKLFSSKTISSTVRLYQYKYPAEAGVPPVKRAMLMCYNAGNVRDADEKNSIFDKEQVMSYLKDTSYPVSLDYALPVFDWALLYQEGKLKKIMPASVVEEYAAYLTQDGNKYTVATDFVYGFNVSSVLIRRGDEIRLETPDMNDVTETAEFLSAHKNNKEAVITLYHLNNNDLKKHSQAIKAIFYSF